jgi:hypothetical protein
MATTKLFSKIPEHKPIPALTNFKLDEFINESVEKAKNFLQTDSFNLIETLSMSDISNLWNTTELLMAYQGFDASVLVVSIHVICCKYLGLKPTDTELNNPQVMEVIVFMLILYALRGSNLGNKLDTFTGEAKAYLTKLTNCGLVWTIQKRRTDVNLARVAGVYSHLLAMILAKNKSFKPIHTSADWPVFLSFPACFSLIPTDNEAMIKAATEWNVGFDKIINSNKDDGKPKPTSKEQLARYQDAMMKGGAFDDVTRRKILTACMAADVHKGVALPL